MTERLLDKIPSVLRLDKLTGARKRQQIDTANRTMFTTIVVASIAISFAIASAQYLFTVWQHNNRIISAKYQAIGNLNNNIQKAGELKQQVDSLVANQDLASVKIDQKDPNTKSILDALPADLETAALATSLQQAIINRSSVIIENITIPSESGLNLVTDPTPQAITLSFAVSGSFKQIEELILDLERTIRPIKVNRVTIENSGSGLRATFDVTTFYQPVRSNLIKEETLK